MDEEVRWLDAAEQTAWRAFVDATRLLFDELDRELQRDAGMPHAYYEILVRLSEAPDRALRMGQLADATLTSPSRISHAVARLEAAGWVRRNSCGHDRRGASAQLTDLGMEVLEAAAPGHVRAVRAHLVDQLTPAEFAQLGAICTKVLDHLEQLRRHP